MAEIEKQVIFTLSLKEMEQFNIVKKENWYEVIMRNWGNKKEIERYLFYLEGEDYNFFECDKETADKIMNKVNSRYNIINLDFKKPSKITEQKKEFINLWAKFKRFVGK